MMDVLRKCGLAIVGGVLGLLFAELLARLMLPELQRVEIASRTRASPVNDRRESSSRLSRVELFRSEVRQFF